MTADSHANLPGGLVVDGRRLDVWVPNQRARRATMAAERIWRLQALPGWKWTAR